MCPGDGDELTGTFTIGSQWSVCPGDGNELTGGIYHWAVNGVCPGDGDELTGTFPLAVNEGESKG